MTFLHRKTLSRLKSTVVLIARFAAAISKEIGTDVFNFKCFYLWNISIIYVLWLQCFLGKTLLPYFKRKFSKFNVIVFSLYVNSFVLTPPCVFGLCWGSYDNKRDPKSPWPTKGFFLLSLSTLGYLGPCYAIVWTTSMSSTSYLR